MNLRIQLLGAPTIVDASGQQQTVRGHQCWALLARVLLTPQPLSRREVAEALFPETNDPLGSLRWCLASLRKSLQCTEALRGDPIQCGLPADTDVDVLHLSDVSLDAESAGGLLAGVEPRCSPEFSTWLLLERERVAGVIDARLRQEVQQAVAGGDSERAIRLAEIGVQRAPFDEGSHILLVQGLISARRFDAASEHVAATTRMFVAELGEEPSPALRSAARRTLSSPPSGVSPRAVIESLLESGRSALSAGAVDAGVDCLRRAAADSANVEDFELQAKSLLELGSALVHSVRGYDDEGAIVLQESIERAKRCGAANLAATAYTELGYVDALAGRRPMAAQHLSQALKISDDDDVLAGVHGVIGFNLIDWGRVDEGLGHFRTSLEHAHRAGNQRRQVWSLGVGAWGLLAAQQLPEADRWLNDCLKLVDELRWTAFRPWPCALFGESRLRQEMEPKAIQVDLEGAFALSCQIGDPCWEAATARALGLSFEALNDDARALQWLVEARTRCVRETDIFVALLVEIIVDLARVCGKLGHAAQSNAYTHEALSLAARAHMDAHVRRAVQIIH